MNIGLRAMIAGTMLALMSVDGYAQGSRRGQPPGFEEGRRPASTARNPGRNAPRYDQQGSGIVRWNTPNADGNFGTPSGGGGGGSGP